jgi:hypothetical protein
LCRSNDRIRISREKELGFPELATVKGYSICLILAFKVEVVEGFGKRHTLECTGMLSKPKLQCSTLKVDTGTAKHAQQQNNRSFTFWSANGID